MVMIKNRVKMKFGFISTNIAIRFIASIRARWHLGALKRTTLFIIRTQKASVDKATIFVDMSGCSTLFLKENFKINSFKDWIHPSEKLIKYILKYFEYFITKRYMQLENNHAHITWKCGNFFPFPPQIAKCVFKLNFRWFKECWIKFPKNSSSKKLHGKFELIITCVGGGGGQEEETIFNFRETIHLILHWDLF